MVNPNPKDINDVFPGNRGGSDSDDLGNYQFKSDRRSPMMVCMSLVLCRRPRSSTKVAAAACGGRGLVRVNTE